MIMLTDIYVCNMHYVVKLRRYLSCSLLGCDAM